MHIKIKEINADIIILDHTGRKLKNIKKKNTEKYRLNATHTKKYKLPRIRCLNVVSLIFSNFFPNFN